MTDRIILILLGVITIRQLISQNFDIPLPNKLKWLLYNKKDIHPPVLCRRVYDIDHLFKQNFTTRSIIEQLIELDSHHIKYYEDGLVHGRSSGVRVSSKYFINTLEASYNDKDLSIMTLAIRNLISKSALLNMIDFVLCIKNGNQILARNIYQGNHSIIYICKLEDQMSSYPMKPNVPASLFSVQYENLDALLNAASHSTVVKLNGIAIDCSVSSGIGLKSSISHFNDLVEKNRLNINKIEHAFILYCHQPFDDGSIAFKLHRYFDMDEEIRALIYKKSIESSPLCYKEIYDNLKSKNLVRNDF